MISFHTSTNYESDVMRIRPRTFWRRAYENDNTKTFCSDTAKERANLKQRLALLLGRSIHERKFKWCAGVEVVVLWRSGDCLVVMLFVMFVLFVFKHASYLQYKI